jgi:hypothetical protein
MVSYEFYLHDRKKGDRLIGILPERRKDPQRTSLEDIMKWPRMVFGDTLDMDDVYFIAVTLCESSDGSQFWREELLTVNESSDFSE